MRNQSASKRREIKETKPERDAFKMEFERCMRCGKWLPFHDRQVHEILRGTGYRPKSVHFRELWLLLGGCCHEEVGSWKLPEQLALKLREDRLYFDLDCVRQVKDNGRRPVVVTMADVRQASMEMGL
jgi:hypothetical protein